MAWLLTLHPGIAYLIVATALLVAFGAILNGTGVRRLLGPLVVGGGLGAWLYLAAQKEQKQEKAEVDFAAVCRDARTEVRRSVRGVSEIFVESGGGIGPGSLHLMETGLPHVGKSIYAPLLRGNPPFARVAVPLRQRRDAEPEYTYAEPDVASPGKLPTVIRAENLPRYGVRWRFEPAGENGIAPYRMEVFDRTSGEVLAAQVNFRYQDEKLSRPRLCPITDPADLVRSVLLPGKA